MACEKFLKPGGGRGRPGFDTVCANCNTIWSNHPKSKLEPKPKVVKESKKVEPIKSADSPTKTKAPRPVGYIAPEDEEQLEVESFLESTESDVLPREAQKSAAPETILVGASPSVENPSVVVDPPKPQRTEADATAFFKRIFGDDYDPSQFQDW